MPKCLLLTGGAGFIGRHLCLELLMYGHRVRILDNLSEQVHGNTPLSLPPDVEIIRGDIRDALLILIRQHGRRRLTVKRLAQDDMGFNSGSK